MLYAVPSVDALAAAAHLDSESACFLDVREDDEFAAGHIPGALHVPLGDLMNAVDQLPRTGPIVVVCRSGARSAHATRVLRSAGLEASNLHDGMFAWVRASLPMAPEDGRVL